jgi:hypothetical protein
MLAERFAGFDQVRHVQQVSSYIVEQFAGRGDRIPGRQIVGGLLQPEQRSNVSIAKRSRYFVAVPEVVRHP